MDPFLRTERPPHLATMIASIALLTPGFRWGSKATHPTREKCQETRISPRFVTPLTTPGSWLVAFPTTPKSYAFRFRLDPIYPLKPETADIPMVRATMCVKTGVDVSFLRGKKMNKLFLKKQPIRHWLKFVATSCEDSCDWWAYFQTDQFASQTDWDNACQRICDADQHW